jgi:hypothetical protein
VGPGRQQIVDASVTHFARGPGNQTLHVFYDDLQPGRRRAHRGPEFDVTAVGMDTVEGREQ